MNKEASITTLDKFSTFLSNTLVTIVLYKTNLCNSITYIQLTKALLQYNLTKKVALYVYDNSPEIDLNIDAHSDVWEITYVNDTTNSGISMAYNKASDFAKLTSKKYLLLTDQDSLFSTNVFLKYYEAIDLNPTIFLFAPIIHLSSKQPFSPCKVVLKRGFPALVSAGIQSLHKYTPVNSGIFIYTNVFLKVGGYNNNVKIDFSDFQFIERYKKNYDLFYVIDSVVIQQFSNEETDKSKLLERFKIYCDGAKNCEKKNFLEFIAYFIIVFIRATSLFKRTKSFDFFKYAFKYYVL